MTEEKFVEVCPYLYHMAARDSWPSIRKNGLLSTEALLDLFEISGSVRGGLLSKHRPESKILFHKKFGSAVIRDQKPMPESRLRRCLPENITPSDWYRFLNRKVFFWATEDRLQSLLNAGSYRSHEHIVLTLDSRSLISRHLETLQLTTMNTGATRPMPRYRDYESFVPLAEFDYERSRRKRGKLRAIAEVTVAYAVLDVLPLTVRVEQVGNSGAAAVLYEPSGGFSGAARSPGGIFDF